MKLLFVLMFSPIMLVGQTNFKWEKVDSLPKTKAQIYSDTKMFIAMKWKSAKNVIQNDDKDGGVILAKGSIVKGGTTGTFNTVYVEYTYSYSVTFKMKDGKYKVEINNVYCESGDASSGNWRGKAHLVDPFDGECEEVSYVGEQSLRKDKLMGIMASMRQELQSIVDDYEKYIKSPTAASGDW